MCIYYCDHSIYIFTQVSIYYFLHIYTQGLELHHISYSDGPLKKAHYYIQHTGGGGGNRFPQCLMLSVLVQMPGLSIETPLLMIGYFTAVH